VDLDKISRGEVPIASPENDLIDLTDTKLSSTRISQLRQAYNTLTKEEFLSYCKKASTSGTNGDGRKWLHRDWSEFAKAYPSLFDEREILRVREDMYRLVYTTVTSEARVNLINKAMDAFFLFSIMSKEEFVRAFGKGVLGSVGFKPGEPAVFTDKVVKIPGYMRMVLPQYHDLDECVRTGFGNTNKYSGLKQALQKGYMRYDRNALEYMHPKFQHLRDQSVATARSVCGTLEQSTFEPLEYSVVGRVPQVIKEGLSMYNATKAATFASNLIQGLAGLRYGEIKVNMPDEPSYIMTGGPDAAATIIMYPFILNNLEDQADMIHLLVSFLCRSPSRELLEGMRPGGTFSRTQFVSEILSNLNIRQLKASVKTRRLTTGRITALANDLFKWIRKYTNPPIHADKVSAAF
jgi:hypothetical protein